MRFWDQGEEKVTEEVICANMGLYGSFWKNYSLNDKNVLAKSPSPLQKINWRKEVRILHAGVCNNFFPNGFFLWIIALDCI